MFSIDKFIKNNQESINDLVESQKLSPEIQKVKEMFDEVKVDCLGNEQLEKYFEELVINCYRYTEIICDFNQLFKDCAHQELSAEEYKQRFSDIDQTRNRIHNATIDSFNILARLLFKNGKKNNWLDSFGKDNRIAYGNCAIKKTIVDIIEFNNKDKGKENE